MQNTKYRTYEEFRRAVGGTDLIEVPRRHGGARIFAKTEWTNPTGSVKDRAAVAMLDAKLEHFNGDLEDIHIVEYSGGNLAISLSYACHLLGIRNTLFVSASTSGRLVNELRAEGSDIRTVETSLGFLGVMEAAKRFVGETPGATFLYQHENLANPRIHQATTGQEIIHDLKTKFGIAAWDGPVAVAVAIGTGGTLAGVFRALAAWCPEVQCYGVTPAELPYGSQCPPNGLAKFAGSGGLGNGIKQRFVASVERGIHGHLTYNYQEALAAKSLFLKRTGQVIGSSSGAAWLAAMKIADQLGPNGIVVTVFACKGVPEERETSEAPDIKKIADIWEQDWFASGAVGQIISSPSKEKSDATTP